jgi:hypothetical protein
MASFRCELTAYFDSATKFAAGLQAVIFWGVKGKFQKQPAYACSGVAASKVFPDQKWRRANSRPEPVFRYFSNARALASESKAMAV